MSKADLSPEAQALLCAIKFSATEPTEIEGKLYTYMMQFHQTGAMFSPEACLQNTGLTPVDLETAMGVLEIKDIIQVTRLGSGSKLVRFNPDFDSPFGAVS